MFAYLKADDARVALLDRAHALGRDIDWDRDSARGLEHTTPYDQGKGESIGDVLLVCNRSTGKAQVIAICADRDEYVFKHGAHASAVIASLTVLVMLQHQRGEIAMYRLGRIDVNRPTPA